jgi:hypothetical protein
VLSCFRVNHVELGARFAHVWRIEGNQIKGFEQLTDTAQFTNERSVT